MENNRYRIKPFMSDYYIFGNGQFAELLSYALIEEKKIKKKNIFFITNKNVNKFNHIYEKEFFLINKKNLNVFIAIGNIKIREKVINKLSNKKYKFPNFISKSSKIMKKSTFGKGNIILPSTSILSPVKKVVSILDINYKGHSNNMKFTKRILLGTMVNLSARVSKKIITISEFSKKQIIKHTNSKAHKINVTLLSGSSDLNISNNITEELIKSK